MAKTRGSSQPKKKYRYEQGVEFHQVIDYSAHLQPLVQAYLWRDYPHRHPTILCPFRSKFTLAPFPGTFKKELKKAKNLWSDSDNRDFYARIICPLYLPEGYHFGFVVIDPRTKEAVIGEPFGNLENFTNLEDLRKCRDIVQEIFPGISIIPSTVRLQSDLSSCGRITAKLLPMLATTDQPLSQAMRDPKILEACSAITEQEQRALYDEQCELFNAYSYYCHDQQGFASKCKTLLAEMGLSPIGGDSRVYAFLNQAFLTSPLHPVTLANLLEAYRLAPLETQNAFKGLIERFLAEEKEKGKDLPDEVRQNFIASCRNMIPALAANYCAQHNKAAPSQPKKVSFASNCNLKWKSTPEQSQSEATVVSAKSAAHFLDEENVKAIQEVLAKKNYHLSGEINSDGEKHKNVIDKQTNILLFSVYADELKTVKNNAEIFATMLECFKATNPPGESPVITIEDESLRTAWQNACLKAGYKAEVIDEMIEVRPARAPVLGR
ncbi:MAG TPA: hypothetical protein VHZ76_01950 [Gammaproteobacteria bacterium]|jgi:hypothetical protein|nr:hypothetical protein [Gammaproteobacteria bacterium]